MFTVGDIPGTSPKQQSRAVFVTLLSVTLQPVMPLRRTPPPPFLREDGVETDRTCRRFKIN
jgi:hypothetical protein